MTLAINPIVGHVSSTYTVKTSVASTFVRNMISMYFLMPVIYH